MDVALSAKNAGIVGAGGAGFPTHIKLDAKADTVIINGAECEPLLQVDQQLMEVYGKELLKGLDLIVKHVGAKCGVVALKAQYHGAVQALKKLLPSYPQFSLYEMGSFYPAGDEQVMVTEVTGRIVPEGGIPFQVGVIVTNVETVLNVYYACTQETRVTEKYFTIAGAVKEPKTIKIPIGISMKEVIGMAGGSTISEYEIVNGGPMMGTVVSPNTPITKTDKGIILLPKGHPVLNSLNLSIKRIIRDAAIACMQCNLCTEVCPRASIGHRLEPHKLMRVAGYGSICDNDTTVMSAYLCCDCRLCEYACVMDLQPWKLNRYLKILLRNKGIENTMNDQPEHPDPFRELKRYPVSKLIRQLDLEKFNVSAPLDDRLRETTRVELLLKQHIGAPAQPVVKVGDSVEKGTEVALMAEGQMGANIHASISGKITEITGNKIIIES